MFLNGKTRIIAVSLSMASLLTVSATFSGCSSTDERDVREQPGEVAEEEETSVFDETQNPEGGYDGPYGEREEFGSDEEEQAGIVGSEPTGDDDEVGLSEQGTYDPAANPTEEECTGDQCPGQVGEQDDFGTSMEEDPVLDDPSSVDDVGTDWQNPGM